MWNRAGVRPLGIEEWGEDVWSPHGVKILGTPVRTPEFVQRVEYAEGHDEGMMDVMRSLLGGLPGNEVQKYEATQIATLLMRLGGLGLRSARRVGHVAFWASWADALHMISKRLPTVVMQVLGHEIDDRMTGGCLGELIEGGCAAIGPGRFCQQAHMVRTQRRPVLHQLTSLNLASGSTAGSSTHLPLLNTTSGRA